ncbi:MAG: LolA family protein [Balneolaceae bacterium]
MKFLTNSAFSTTLLFVLMVSYSGIAVAQEDTPRFNQLKAMFEDGTVFVADFNHVFEDAFTGERQETDARITIGKDRYRIENDLQAVVVDGETSVVYDATKNRVITSDYVEEEDDFAPSRMLQGVDESYTVTEQQAGNETVLELITDDPFAIFTSVTIRLSENLHPTEIYAVDQAGNVLTTRFRNGFFDDPAEGLFELSIPDDAEVIDLRYDS